MPTTKTWKPCGPNARFYKGDRVRLGYAPHLVGTVVRQFHGRRGNVTIKLDGCTHVIYAGPFNLEVFQ